MVGWFVLWQMEFIWAIVWVSLSLTCCGLGVSRVLKLVLGCRIANLVWEPFSTMCLRWVMWSLMSCRSSFEILVWSMRSSSRWQVHGGLWLCRVGRICLLLER